MRKTAPICYVPELDATLLTRRDDVFACEKIVDVFSSYQPDGLMVQLMGENMMRKDGDAHLIERRQALPAFSPATVKKTWISQFRQDTLSIIEKLSEGDTFDVVTDYAMPVSAHALRHITGLTNLTPAQMDEVSQAMIDGIANYTGDVAKQQRCHAATQLIDDSIETMLQTNDFSSSSMLSVLTRAGQAMESIRANIKLAISGGQNEPRDAIAGMVATLLHHPEQLARLQSGELPWVDAFEEYARWMSPIGMSPRRIAKRFEWNGITFDPESKAFLMFGSANRDEQVFDQPDVFNINRDNRKSVSFGAGPHFCAGAVASRVLIAEVALPLLFERFPNMALDGDVAYRGWAFRGPLAVPIRICSSPSATNPTE